LLSFIERLGWRLVCWGAWVRLRWKSARAVNIAAMTEFDP
jgi:hypothetical protein